jgi:hypothetical protein
MKKRQQERPAREIGNATRSVRDSTRGRRSKAVGGKRSRRNRHVNGFNFQRAERQ